MTELRDNLPFTPTDYRDAAGDYLAARFGAKQIDAHPTAERIADHGVTLAEMALTFGSREALRRRVNMNRIQAMDAGFSTSDFASVLEGAIRHLVATTYDIESDHRRIAAPIEARNFNEVSFPQFDLNADLPEILENAKLRNTVSVSTSGGESASVLSYGAIVAISRKVVINNDIGLIETVFRQLAAAAARLEAESVFAVLEANPTLADGSAMFTGDNLLASSALSKANLGSAFSALRRQTGASGATTNNKPAFLVVPPEKEVDALSIVSELSNSGRVVQVIGTPWVASTNWYLLADPSRSPVVGLLRLADRAVRVESGRGSVRTDTLPTKVAVDFGATALGRVGAVKGQEGA